MCPSLFLFVFFVVRLFSVAEISASPTKTMGTRQPKCLARWMSADCQARRKHTREPLPHDVRGSASASALSVRCGKAAHRVMDEPFGAVDPLQRRARRVFARCIRKLGLTRFMITHDMTEAVLWPTGSP